MNETNGYVKTDIDKGVASVTFFHPKSNSLPGAILKELASAISKAGASPDVRVIVLRSAGDKAFCAGASFDELLAIDNEAQGKEFFSGFSGVINAMRKAPCFVIGRIHGKAVGGGVGLASAVDIAYASDMASARLSELAIGIGPFVVGPAVERKVGTGAFALMSATPATWRDAAWCKAQGLYAEVYPDTQLLDDAVAAHARELSEYSPEAMLELKRITWRGTEDWDQLLDERAAMSGKLVLSKFTSEAIAQFRTAK